HTPIDDTIAAGGKRALRPARRSAAVARDGAFTISRQNTVAAHLRRRWHTRGSVATEAGRSRRRIGRAGAECADWNCHDTTSSGNQHYGNVRWLGQYRQWTYP